MPPSDDQLRYPIGPFRRPSGVTPSVRTYWLADLRHLPLQLRAAVDGLVPEQLDTPYREGGWTIRQVVHHVPDSHLNGYVRTKWALTETSPQIKGYDQTRWAEQPDRHADIEASLALIGALHTRWVGLLEALDEEAWSSDFIHPDTGRQSLGDLLALYAWHGRHHTAHILSLKARRGW